MKKFLSLVFVTLTAAIGFAADQVPLFNATLSIGKEHRFVLVSPAGKASSFLRIGENFEGYTIKAYDAKESALDLEKDGKITRVTLVGDAAIANAPAATPATLADAEELFRLMRFDDMMKKLLDGQKKAMGPAMQQSMAQGLARGGLNLDEGDKATLAALQAKALDKTLNVITGPEMRAAMAQIYSEVFTKEELGSMAAFYSTPGGQALTEKQPEVQQKMGATMMPLIMKNQQASQQEIRDFVTGLRGKYGAGGPAATPGGTPAPAPVPAPAPKQ